MDAITEASEIVRAHPSTVEGRFFSFLLRQLACGGRISMHRLYHLDRDVFVLALRVMDEWWVYRYYAGGDAAMDPTEQRQRPRGMQ